MQRLSRHYDQIVSVDVILNVEKLDQIAEASVHVAGRTLFATDTSQDMYAAIDGLVDKLDKQVRRLKDKLRGHQHVKPQPLDPED
jgi:putative sigma-54 modulation protein